MSRWTREIVDCETPKDSPVIAWDRLIHRRGQARADLVTQPS